VPGDAPQGVGFVAEMGALIRLLAGGEEGATEQQQDNDVLWGEAQWNSG